MGPGLEGFLPDSHTALRSWIVRTFIAAMEGHWAHEPQKCRRVQETACTNPHSSPWGSTYSSIDSNTENPKVCFSRFTEKVVGFLVLFKVMQPMLKSASKAGMPCLKSTVRSSTLRTFTSKTFFELPHLHTSIQSISREVNRCSLWLCAFCFRERECGKPWGNHPPNWGLRRSFQGHEQRIMSKKCFFFGHGFWGWRYGSRMWQELQDTLFSVVCFARFASCNWDHDQINYELEASCSAWTSQP